MVKKTTKRAVGAGLAAAAAAVAAGYYFFGKNGKRHRGKAVKWAGEMKKEVIRQAKGMGTMTADDFGKVVETVAATYKGMKSVDLKEVGRAANELKSNWQSIKRELGKTKRQAVSGARSARKLMSLPKKKSAAKNK